MAGDHVGSARDARIAGETPRAFKVPAVHFFVKKIRDASQRPPLPKVPRPEVEEFQRLRDGRPDVPQFLRRFDAPHSGEELFRGDESFRIGRSFEKRVQASIHAAGEPVHGVILLGEVEPDGFGIEKGQRFQKGFPDRLHIRKDAIGCESLHSAPVQGRENGEGPAVPGEQKRRFTHHVRSHEVPHRGIAHLRRLPDKSAPTIYPRLTEEGHGLVYFSPNEGSHGCHHLVSVRFFSPDLSRRRNSR